MASSNLCDIFQNFMGNCAWEIQNNGFSLCQDKKEKLEEEDHVEQQIVVIGKQLVHQWKMNEYRAIEEEVNSTISIPKAMYFI
ncbi:hypothetical protein KY290_008454 [Solanum tuberosum]|uniref:Uncharacterized protein n=1 Tax=Solanum tuberosum TaxID=4113 RepID=A0ABQ7WAC3_SOLTU|nr:hypothetical protein KY290_008454 [Solanum tuberosum]